jgi:hypothetical protein
MVSSAKLQACLPFGPISERKDKLQAQEQDIAIFEEIVHDWRSFVSKWPCFLIVGLIRRAHKAHHYRCYDEE